mgnify:FL=1
MQKDTIYLTAGIVVTVLFWLLRVQLIELVYTAPGYSDNMYNLGIYDTVAMVITAVAWVGAGIYYYVINSVRFDRWWHWLAVLAVVAVLTPVVCYSVNTSVFSDNGGISYPAETAAFQTATVLYSVLMFVVASFSIRWWSSNCRHTPIPQ